jgi:hypothetical protein
MTSHGDAQRWMQNLLAHPTEECVLWPFASDKDGYGKAQHPFDHKPRPAHVVMWCIYHRKIWPEGMQSRHLCGTNSCVNPRHIVPGTAQQNADDRVSHGTSIRGSQHWSAVLTETDIPVICARVAAGEMQITVAADYGVATPVINRIWLGKSWKHVERIPA